MIARIKTFFEHYAFGVCAWWGEKLNIKTEQVRLSFIYLGCVTAGLPLVLYLEGLKSFPGSPEWPNHARIVSPQQ